MAGERETTTVNGRTGDWTGDEWASGDGTAATSRTGSRRWAKTEYVGDRGSGLPAPQSPSSMPEGETSVSGNRHVPGEQHWQEPGSGTDDAAEPRSGS